MRNSLRLFAACLIFQSCGYPLSDAYRQLDQKKYTEAKKSFTEKIESKELKKPLYRYDAFLGRGIANNLLKDNVSAIADYDSCIKIKPQTDYAYCNKSIALTELGKPDEALDEINFAIQRYSLNSLSNFQRAKLFVYFKNYEGALEDLLIAIKLWNSGSNGCNLSCPLTLRAMIYQKMGEPQKALYDYIRAGNKSKDYVLMNYYQALCYMQKQDTLNFKLAIKRVSTLDKKNSVWLDMASLLESKFNGSGFDIVSAEGKIKFSAFTTDRKNYLLACANALAGKHEVAVTYLAMCMKENRGGYYNMLLDYHFTETGKLYNLYRLYLTGGADVTKL